ncbi:MAG: shikimate dehydrogenase [Alphaproteobacteria bacterium]|nr:shikimate dehydrogenase [Alphaproteobacteria bacterium]
MTDKTSKLSPIRAAVIGHPVGHSLSPLIHRHWITTYGLSGSYDAIDVAPAELATGIASFVAEGYAGFNVTVPHKQAVMALCDTCDPAARAIGAVNTVVISGGKPHGRNTDAAGFIMNLKESLPGFSFTDARALVLGAGGAARAVVYGLQQEGVSAIRVTNRTAERAQALGDDFGLEVVSWDEKEAALSDVTLLVNTTALGMTGQPSLTLDLSALAPGAAVYDIVYKPLMTPLLCAAKDRGNPIVTGIGMLLHQAGPAFEAWFGIAPAVTPALRRTVEEAAR